MNKRIANKIMADFDRWYLSGGKFKCLNYSRRQFETADARLNKGEIVVTVMLATVRE